MKNSHSSLPPVARALSRGFTLIELMIVVAIIGLLAAIAVPNFLKFQARASQAEAKANLKGFFTSAKANYASENTYVCNACGFSPEKKNKYAYKFGTGVGDIPTDSSFPATVACAYAGTRAAAQTASTFIANASANIDSDATCDSWSINELNDLKNDVNDVDT